ncbi:hypothetical protein LB505_001794 [Fusarium chuoi]|nr:hypothetical protein LB505_001794 [Fusarium chuoi]
MSPRLPGLKLIVSLDPLEQGELASHTKASVLNEIASQHGIQIYSITQVEEIGAKSGRAPRAPSRNDICTINYTSGTTGNPKGLTSTDDSSIRSPLLRALPLVSSEVTFWAWLMISRSSSPLVSSQFLASSTVSTPPFALLLLKPMVSEALSRDVSLIPRRPTCDSLPERPPTPTSCTTESGPPRSRPLWAWTESTAWSAAVPSLILMSKSSCAPLSRTTSLRALA